MLIGALFVLPLLLADYALAPTLWWSAAGFLAVGAGYIAVLSGLNTVVQLRAPAEARGRVLSIYMMGLGIVYPIGAVVQGWVADTIGVRSVTVAGAALLMGVLVGVAALRPGILVALGDRPAGPHPVDDVGAVPRVAAGSPVTAPTGGGGLGPPATAAAAPVTVVLRTGELP
jgi:hypothetical protein